eukprot:CAMPEP_0183588452 /NCGR_PEP_ID=MMETSP0371-20130417/160802_1 /TAXON_ID=268820 /ORGANISM="Peridinium aciculiferum, Strain PAER-2" /LENGTH=34 /DNA_ID= /DNA_START= /DNA_END= /DNA_ORIENTATION=
MRPRSDRGHASATSSGTAQMETAILRPPQAYQFG